MDLQSLRDPSGGGGDDACGGRGEPGVAGGQQRVLGPHRGLQRHREQDVVQRRSEAVGGGVWGIGR